MQCRSQSPIRPTSIVPDVLSESEIDAYRIRLLELAEREDGSARVHTDDHGQLVRWLVNKGEMFERLVAHPKMVPFFEYLLGDDYTLSTLTSNIISPGHPTVLTIEITRWEGCRV